MGSALEIGLIIAGVLIIVLAIFVVVVLVMRRKERHTMSAGELGTYSLENRKKLAKYPALQKKSKEERDRLLREDEDDMAAELEHEK